MFTQKTKVDSKISSDYKFQLSTVKEAIDNILFDYLSTKEYNAEKAQHWTKEISECLRNKVKTLGYKNHKFLVNVILLNRKGGGAKIGTRCLWHKECDKYTYCNFTNNTIACTAIVYAAYCKKRDR